MIAYRELVDLSLEREPTQKIRLAAEAFLRTTVFTGLAVTYSPLGDSTHDMLFARGYQDAALADLRTVFVTTDPMYRRIVTDSSLLTWRGGHFEQGPAARTWLVPAGYRNGFSAPVIHEQLGEIGSVHANSYVPDFGDQQLDAAGAFACFLSVVISQKAVQDRARLTPREQHVVRCIAKGASNPEIAEELCVSRRTVATHVENILRKLGARSRVGIAVEATRLGII